MGAGHAHLALLAPPDPTLARHAVTLVDPGTFWYSGLATAVVAGRHPAALDRVDPADVARRAGAAFVRDRVVDVGLDARVARTEGGRALPWDALSVATGSRVAPGVPGGAGVAVPVKPLGGLVAAADDLAAALERDPGRPRGAVVAGGGASGCEVALALARRASRVGGALSVTLAAAEGLVPELGAGPRRSLAAVLARRGVVVLDGVSVSRVDGGVVLTDDGGRLPFDLLVDATGLAPASARALGLPPAPDGGVAVDACLRSPGHPRVHAAGDCASGDPRLPLLGVHAVKAAPVLAHNLAAALDGSSPRPWRPRSRALRILPLGWGEALATWGPAWWTGRLSQRWKTSLDLQFLQRLTAGGENG